MTEAIEIYDLSTEEANAIEEFEEDLYNFASMYVGWIKIQLSKDAPEIYKNKTIVDMLKKLHKAESTQHSDFEYRFKGGCNNAFRQSDSDVYYSDGTYTETCISTPSHYRTVLYDLLVEPMHNPKDGE